MQMLAKLEAFTSSTMSQLTDKGMLNAETADAAIPVLDARFSKSGDPRYFWTERVETRDEEITLTWHEIGDPLLPCVPSSVRRRCRSSSGTRACRPR